jgi:hypothetical protein
MAVPLVSGLISHSPRSQRDRTRRKEPPPTNFYELRDNLETNPSASQYIAEWVAFALVSLLPLSLALVMLAVARDPTQRALVAARVQLERHARMIAAVILIMLAAVLMRNGIAGLTS